MELVENTHYILLILTTLRKFFITEYLLNPSNLLTYYFVLFHIVYNYIRTGLLL
jgi:hypothetical protein